MSSILDTRYKSIKLDLLLENKNERMYFNLSDNETSDFYLFIAKNNEDINLAGFKASLYVCKPNKVVESKILEYNSELDCFYCNLENKFKNIEGDYLAQVIIEDETTGEKKVTRSKFGYYVSGDILSEGNQIVDESVANNILSRVIALEQSSGATGASIDDNATSTNKTWSSSKISQQMQSIVNGANLVFSNITSSEIFEVDNNIYGDIQISTNNITMLEGESATFSIRLSQAPSVNQIVNLSTENNLINLSSSSLTFTSANYNVAQTVTIFSSVDDNEIDNTSIITISTKNNNNKTITVSITDTQNSTNQNVMIESISLSDSSVSLEIGETKQLNVSILPSTASNKMLTWETSNNNISVSDTGLVTALNVGNSTVTVRTTDGSNLTSQCEFLVTEIISNDYSQFEIFNLNSQTFNGTDAWTDSKSNIPVVVDDVSTMTLTEKGYVNIPSTTKFNIDLSKLNLDIATSDFTILLRGAFNCINTYMNRFLNIVVGSDTFALLNLRNYNKTVNSSLAGISQVQYVLDEATGITTIILSFKGNQSSWGNVSYYIYNETPNSAKRISASGIVNNINNYDTALTSSVASVGVNVIKELIIYNRFFNTTEMLDLI